MKLKQAPIDHEKISRDIGNRAWILFNANLNQGLSWVEAREKALRDITEKRKQYDDAFEIDPDDPLASEALWNLRMEQFDQLLRHLNSIN